MNAQLRLQGLIKLIYARTCAVAWAYMFSRHCSVHAFTSRLPTDNSVIIENSAAL